MDPCSTNPHEAQNIIQGVCALTLPELAWLAETLPAGDTQAVEIFRSITGAPPIRVGRTRRHVALELPAAMIRPGDRIWTAIDKDGPRGRQCAVRRVELEASHVRIVTDTYDDRVCSSAPVWWRAGNIERPGRRPTFRIITGEGLGEGLPIGLLRPVG